jgi:nucleotide-binding universal stress UspA family protein
MRKGEESAPMGCLRRHFRRFWFGTAAASQERMKRILVGLDGSFRARSVLKGAIAFAEQAHAKLVLMRAVGLPADFPAAAYAAPPSDVAKLLELNAHQELERLGRDLSPEMNGGVRVETGVPWEAICRAAQAEDADLIFIGTRADGAGEHALDMTTTMVVNNADRAVLVFRETRKGATDAATYDAELHCEPF